MIKNWKNVLIVLGCAPNRNGTPGYLMRNRVKKAVSLFKKNNYNIIIFSGGANKTPIPEAELMRLMAAKDIPLSKTIIEGNSLSTIQNAVFTWEIIKDKNVKKLTVMSSSFHIARVKYIFKHLYTHLNCKMIFIGSGEKLSKSVRFDRFLSEKRQMWKMKLFGIK